MTQTNTKKLAPATAQTAVQPQINVWVYPVENRGNTLAYADVNVSGFVVKGIRVIHGTKGEFLSMPARQKQNGEYEDMFFPATKQARDQLTNAVLGAYYQAMEQQSAQVQQPEQADRMQMS